MTACDVWSGAVVPGLVVGQTLHNNMVAFDTTGVVAKVRSSLVSHNQALNCGWCTRSCHLVPLSAWLGDPKSAKVKLVLVVLLGEARAPFCLVLQDQAAQVSDFVRVVQDALGVNLKLSLTSHGVFDMKTLMCVLGVLRGV